MGLVDLHAVILQVAVYLNFSKGYKKNRTSTSEDEKGESRPVAERFEASFSNAFLEICEETKNLKR
jgi:hypothetical protein